MKNIKKLLSLLLCGIMLFGMFPASLFAADGDTGDGSGTISETFVPEITWKRTFEYEHRHDTAANQHKISADFMRAIKQIISQQQPTPITLPII